tara:strand:+ start:132 stop:590 length:459 start_codon:yes stop_codon:yes gene_type:complete
MTTNSKDFRVKNGIQVAGDAVINGNIAAASPTADNHVVTLSYLNANMTTAFDVSSIAPSSPTDGDTWFDSVTRRLNVYYDGLWITMAGVEDTLTVPQHIHDTSIDGSGLIVTQFSDGAAISSPQGSPVDAGGVSTLSWDSVLDGGLATDSFN